MLMAEDTVIQYAERKRDGKYYFQDGKLLEKKVIVVGSLQELLKAQAKLSVKAGREDVVGWVEEHICVLDENQLVIPIKESPEWRAQLKDWELEDDS